MIEIDEETVDKAIDDILGTDEPVRDAETPSVGGGAQVRPDERATCRRCGKIFARNAGSTRTLCQECFAASHSRKRTAENGRQMKTGDEDPVQKAWDELATEANTEANTEASPAREPEPLEREPPEPEPGTLTADREDGAWGVLSALYGATRDVAGVVGADPQDVIEALFRINSAMDYMQRKRSDRA